MLAQLAGPWRMFPVTGAAWLIISAVVLRFSIAPVAAVGVLRTPKLTVYSVNMNDRPPGTSLRPAGPDGGPASDSAICF